MAEMVETKINGRWSLKLPDYRAARPEWTDPGWETERLNSMWENLRYEMLVYDIGTEEGDLSALYARWGCELVLVEPNPRAWPNVKAIWEANDLPQPLVCVEAFAADHDSSEAPPLTNEWPACTDGPMIGDHAFCTMGEHADKEILRVRIDTIASYIDPPDAITIDVEGAELQVLTGAESVLSTNRPLLWISVHPHEMAEQFGDSPSALWSYLERFGYEWRLLAYDHELHVFAWHPSKHEPVLP